VQVPQEICKWFEDDSWQIVDHRNKQPSSWVAQMNLPIQKLARDDANVVRIQHNISGQPVIIVAGISDRGAEAASEVVYLQIKQVVVSTTLPTSEVCALRTRA
jgi:hypothetical protein